MTLLTEPIGSIPRPASLVEARRTTGPNDPSLEPFYVAAVQDTIARFEATGSPVVTDGEQRKYHNVWTYSVQGLPNTSPDGFRIPFSAGHVRRMPRLTAGPGTCDDCGFSPFSDDVSTSRETAFAKIGARVAGTWLASKFLGGGDGK